MALRVVFMGTPTFAIPTLAALVAAQHKISAIYTRAPKPKGRGQAFQRSAVHDWAAAHISDVLVYTPASFRKSPGDVMTFLRIPCDVVVVAAYGLILPPDILNAPRLGCLNVHASLLPRWRGAAPIHHAIWAGDLETGVTMMRMDEGLDTGPMMDQYKIPIGDTATTPEIEEVLAKKGAELMVRTLARLEKGEKIQEVPQPAGGVTFAPLLQKDQGKIDWCASASRIDCQIRALKPWPGTYVFDHENQPLKILSGRAVQEGANPMRAEPGTLLDRAGHVVCGENTLLRLDQIQTASGKKMGVSDAVNGGILQIGARVGRP